MTTSPQTFEARDPDAGVRVAAFYEEHGRTILGLCRFLLRDAAEAEDAAQQAFLSAYRSMLGGAVPREPAAWLATIARNECWGRIKRRMREPLTLHEVPSELPDPLELAVQNADLTALREGLASLSRPQREAFLLREFAGLSYVELAMALGVTEPAVDSLLFRARTRLRRALTVVNGALLPVALRDQLGQLIPGFDQPAAGTLARLASLPIAAKLAAAGAGAVLVVAGSTGLGRHAQAPAHTAARLSARPLERHVAAAPLPSRRPSQVLSLPRSSRAVLPSPSASSQRAARAQDPSPAPTRGSRPGGGDAPGDAPGGGDGAPADPGTVPVADPPPDGGGGVTPTLGGGAPPTEGRPDDSPPDGAGVAPTQPEPEPEGEGSDGQSSEPLEQPEQPEQPEPPKSETTSAAGS